MTESTTDPEAWDRIRAIVNARDTRTRYSVGVNIFPDANELIREAAERRGMALSAFVRQAALAVAVHDLDDEERWLEVTEDLPVRTETGKTTDANDPALGPWRVARMERRS